VIDEVKRARSEQLQQRIAAAEARLTFISRCSFNGTDVTEIERDRARRHIDVDRRLLEQIDQ
jgi:hypothetical protein